MSYSHRSIGSEGIRKCPIDGCFLPRFRYDECTCTKCGMTYSLDAGYSGL